MKDVDLLVIVGIGGSNLGALAVAQACLGSHFQFRNTPKVLFADTVDDEHTEAIVAELELAVRQKKNVVLNVVSKSGTTTETAALFAVLADSLKKLDNWRDCVVVTTDKGSRLWSVAKQEAFHLLEVPKSVGGRYSVFSPVGLFPLAVMGIDIQELVKGAVAGRSSGLKPDLSNPALSSAITLWHYYKGCAVHDTFLFSHRLEGTGRWYRQLLGESMGKHHGKASVGYTPTVSIGSVDLHSVGQLYIDGPADKFTTFVSIAKDSKVAVPVNKSLATLVPDVQGKSLHRIMDAILGGTKAAFAKKKKPFISITLPDAGEKSIGELLQLKMLETIYLCKLANVNPFDQPAVEQYKQVTRQLLAK
jgi:glucose-6-phosphate isomerase